MLSLPPEYVLSVDIPRSWKIRSASLGELTSL